MTRPLAELNPTNRPGHPAAYEFWTHPGLQSKRNTRAEIVAAGFEPETVARVCALVKGAEFKRRQAAPGVKVAWRSFGSGWRMPLAAAPLP
jgi:NH3-dependent NAD+ synthetase